MYYKRKTKFFNIPVMADNDILTQQGEQQQLTQIDNLLKFATYGIANCIVEQGNYDFSNSNGQWKMILSPKQNKEYSLFGLLNKKLLYSTDIIQSPFFECTGCHYIYAQYNGQVYESSSLTITCRTTFEIVDSNYALENENCLLLCTVDFSNSSSSSYLYTIDDKYAWISNQGKIYAGNMLSHPTSAVNPHGENLYQNNIFFKHLTTNFKVNKTNYNYPVYGAIYQDVLSQGPNQTIVISLPRGIQPMFVTTTSTDPTIGTITARYGSDVSNAVIQIPQTDYYIIPNDNKGKKVLIENNGAVGKTIHVKIDITYKIIDGFILFNHTGESSEELLWNQNTQKYESYSYNLTLVYNNEEQRYDLQVSGVDYRASIVGYSVSGNLRDIVWITDQQNQGMIRIYLNDTDRYELCTLTYYTDSNLMPTCCDHCYTYYDQIQNNHICPECGWVNACPNCGTAFNFEQVGECPNCGWGGGHEDQGWYEECPDCGERVNRDETDYCPNCSHYFGDQDQGDECPNCGQHRVFDGQCQVCGWNENWTQCPDCGQWYDSTLYESCPHCEQNQGGDQGDDQEGNQGDEIVLPNGVFSIIFSNSNTMNDGVTYSKNTIYHITRNDNNYGNYGDEGLQIQIAKNENDTYILTLIEDTQDLISPQIITTGQISNDFSTISNLSNSHLKIQFHPETDENNLGNGAFLIAGTGSFDNFYLPQTGYYGDENSNEIYFTSNSNVGGYDLILKDIESNVVARGYTNGSLNEMIWDYNLPNIQWITNKAICFDCKETWDYEEDAPYCPHCNSTNINVLDR